MSTNVVIIGAGVVGLTLALRIKANSRAHKITIIEKEESIGKHSSGRNSGVLHAGIYYKPGTIKSRLCVEGARRMKEWIKERDLPLKECGKLIVPQEEHLDPQLDMLCARGKENGAVVSLIDESDIKTISPSVRSSTGRALWSPNTSVTKPITVIRQMEKELKEQGVVFMMESKGLKIRSNKNEIVMKNGESIKYDYAINCAGIYAEEIAKESGIRHEYSVMPFKGIYWDISNSSDVNVTCNVYPVPDLNVPFLGIHFTPGAGEDDLATIGPTANIALGRESYKTTEKIELIRSLETISTIARLAMNKESEFRKYVKDQSVLNFEPFMMQQAKKLMPEVKREDIKLSSKVAIRAQIFNKKTKKLENDFIFNEKNNVMHVINSISPAFTASFEMADYIIKNCKGLNM